MTVVVVSWFEQGSTGDPNLAETEEENRGEKAGACCGRRWNRRGQRPCVAATAEEETLLWLRGDGGRWCCVEQAEREMQQRGVCENRRT